MESRKRRLYINGVQKKKLLEYVTKYPQLITSRPGQNFSHSDAQILWRRVANDLNSLPGARKTWRQWKKTWQDLKSKTRKRSMTENKLSASMMMLTPAEREALGLKKVSSTTNNEETNENTEFAMQEDDIREDSNLNNDENSMSDPDSPPDVKVFASTHKTRSQKLSNHRISKDFDTTSSSKECCDLNILAEQEKHKLEIKEDYLNFKKDYLRQKLELMKEQTEALKNIAKELSNFK